MDVYYQDLLINLAKNSLIFQIFLFKIPGKENILKIFHFSIDKNYKELNKENIHIRNKEYTYIHTYIHTYRYSIFSILRY